MSLEKANGAYKRLLASASKFASPALKTFFMTKAANDFKRFSKGSHSDESIAQAYINSQTKLSESLDRVSGIYNTYRDRDAMI